jgi:phosphomannomutase / phosphoglucomutase
MEKLQCFKAYDIRGKVPEDLSVDLAYLIGVSYADIINPGKVIVGFDVRLESVAISNALIKGLTDSGVDVVNIGLCGTEEVYFQTFSRESQGVGGGIMITASHNPKGYNGMKMVKSVSRPMSGDDDLKKIHDLVLQFLNSEKEFVPFRQDGKVVLEEEKSSYISHILGYVKNDNLRPLKIVVNPGNGPAGQIIKLLETKLPFEFVSIHDIPDGNFPNGVPNPMIVENRAVTSAAVIDSKADFGVAWDGDFDRCFLFDENGRFIDGYYLVGLLAKSFLKKSPGERIIHDPRLIWNTIELVENNGGIAVEAKSGHSFIKEKMREVDAIYGGEMSAHHYFRDFAYCDSGMLPWLLISELLCESGAKLSELVEQSMKSFPCSGEINYQVKNINESIVKIEKHFSALGANINYSDGISIEFSDWRFNLRGSNTEPLLRLNLETRGNQIDIDQKIKEIELIIL